MAASTTSATVTVFQGCISFQF